VPEVVEGNEADGLAGFVIGSALPGFDNKGFNGRVLPTGQIVAAGGGEGDLDRRSPIPGGELGVPVPLVDLLDVPFAGGSQRYGLAVYCLDLFGVDTLSSPLEYGDRLPSLQV
jgi:hypothetical protein